MKNIENKKRYIIIAIITLLLITIGGTYAYLSWSTTSNQKTNIVFTVQDKFSCAADGGGNITSSDIVLAPTDCTNSTYAIQRTVTVSPTLYNDDLGVSMNLWLDINNIGTGLSNSNNFKYALTTEPDSCTTGVVSSGSFKSKTTGGKVILLDEKEYQSTATETYYLYIWLDKAETSTDTMNQSFSLSLNGDCTSTEIISTEPEAPVLDSGMIPIVLSEDGVATTVLASDSSWYSYEDKEWANVVLVDLDSRSTYQNTTGVIVDSSDILAYYVWIPRYKYKIWTTSTSSSSGSGSGSEQTIEIAFESKDTAKSTGTAVDEYLTHPAFTFGDEELAGFWVGKFETTGSAATPTILPNVLSLRWQNISKQFTTSLLFSGGTLSNGAVTFAGSNTYGLTTDTDSHMMKNSEWGAVAYLSHSQYGINQEIYINNSSLYYTGRSGGNVGGSQNTLATQFPESSTSTSRYNRYGYYTWTGQAISSSGTIGEITDSSLGTKASTTGNITGVYDMSGGAYEYVMGYYSGANSNYATNPDTYFGYTSSSNYAGFTSRPASKYWDEYTTTLSKTACNGGICYGHALSETSSWYSDYAYFVSASNPWFLRGRINYNGAYAGAFDSYFNTGKADGGGGFRSVVIKGA